MLIQQLYCNVAALMNTIDKGLVLDELRNLHSQSSR